VDDLNKCIKDYKAYIVDFDGTLYYQPYLRLKMIMHMFLFLILHPWRLGELMIVIYYRHIRENGKFSKQDEFEKKEWLDTANKFNMSVNAVKKIIGHWMFEVPLPYILEGKDDILISFLNEQMEDGKKVIIYSDYPVKDKLCALTFSPGHYFYSGDNMINCLKPNNKGLENIITMLGGYGVNRKDIIFLGDRKEKDGICAQKSKIDYLILKAYKYQRRKQWDYYIDDFKHVKVEK